MTRAGITGAVAIVALVVLLLLGTAHLNGCAAQWELDECGVACAKGLQSMHAWTPGRCRCGGSHAAP